MTRSGLDQFILERERITRVPRCRVSVIEHFGSTAAVDLAAKPIIDITAVLTDHNVAEACLLPLGVIGDTSVREQPGSCHWHYCISRSDADLSCHLHLAT